MMTASLCVVALKWAGTVHAGFTWVVSMPWVEANIRVCNMLSVQLWEVLKIPQRMAAAGAAEGEQQGMVHAEALPATVSSLNQSGVMPKLSLRWG